MKRMLSGIKPTGQLTLGNYIGALRNFVNYQDDYEMIVFIANLHCITEYQDPADLRKNLTDAVAVQSCQQLLVWVVRDKFNGRLLYALGQRLCHLLEVVGCIDVARLYLHGVGIHRTEHQDIVDESEQHVAVVMDDTNHLALVVGRLDGLQQVRETNDGIQRGTARSVSRFNCSCFSIIPDMFRTSPKHSFTSPFSS